jgi:AraC-like DNA-binding protein
MRVSTEHVESGVRNDMRRAATAPSFEADPGNGAANETLESPAHSSLAGCMIVGSSNFNQPQPRHDRKPTIQHGLDQYLLQLYLVGSNEDTCEGRPIPIRAGDICIFDLARPFSTAATTGSTVSLILPRGPLERATRGRSLHGVVMPAERPLTRILADFVLGMCRAASSLSNDEAAAVEQSLLQLLLAGLAQHIYVTPEASLSLMQMLRQQIIEFIETHLYERELGPVLLMQRHQISRAHLYRTFAADGGIAKIIRDKRLDAAYREIAVGAKISGKSITEIAMQLGFSNSSQFARAFQRRFAMTPTEARQEGQRIGHLGRSSPDLQDHFARHVDGWLEKISRNV